MKRIIIFLAFALAFIMLSSTFLSIGKIFDKDPDVTEAPSVTTAPSEEDGLGFYVENKMLQPATSPEDLSKAEFDGCVGYFTKADKTYFFYVVNADGNFAEKAVSYPSLWISGYGKGEFGGFRPKWGYTLDFENVVYLNEMDDFIDLSSVSSSAEQGYIAVVMFEINSSEIPTHPVEFAYRIQQAGYASYMIADPEAPEGPSAGDDTQPETPPQVDPWIPEGPGAEDVPWPEAPGAE